jgi:bla regulator protein blaR1
MIDPGDPILAHLWQSTLFAATAWFFTLLLRRNGAHVRYRVLFAASLKFVLPFALLVRAGSFIQWHPIAARTPVWVSNAERFGQPLVVFPPIGADIPYGAAAASSGVFNSLALAVWLIGFLSLATCWVIRFRRVAELRRRAVPIRIAGCPIPVLTLPGSIEPGVFGIRRPALLIPAGLLTDLPEPQLAAIVAHELCHVRRRDNLTAAIHMGVQAIFWFHPAVWWLGARLIEERERACDEEVLRLGGKPRDYADGILNVCRRYAESPVSCVAGVGGSNLRRRIERIMAGRAVSRVHFAIKMAMLGVIVLTVAVPIVIGLFNVSILRAQDAAPAAAVRFEVASIKPCKNQPGQMRGSADSSPGRLNTGCDLLVDENNLGLIQRAYVRFAGGHANPLSVTPIKGGPKWIHSDMYRIEAKAAGSPSNELMAGPMLQALLADRFNLRIHRAVSQGPVYDLTSVSGTGRLKPFAEGSCIQMPLTFPRPIPPAGQRFCKALIMFLGPAIDAEGSTLGEFSKLLNLVLDRPVIDKTGITGRFNIRLDFARDQATQGLRQPLPPDGPAALPSDPNRPAIFTAVQEQLGLKLTSARGPVETLIIDHVERPSEN